MASAPLDEKSYARLFLADDYPYIHLSRTGRLLRRWRVFVGETRGPFYALTRRGALRLGLSRKELKLARPAPKGRYRRRKLVPVSSRLTGGRWDETYSLLRRCLSEFASVAGEADRWNEAYAHFYALENIVARQMKRG